MKYFAPLLTLFIPLFFLSGMNINIAFIFLISQSLLGIIGLYKINKGFYLQDIRVFFILSFTLYSCFLPIISILGIIKGFNFYLSQTILLYGIALLSFNFYTLFKRRKWNNNLNIKLNSIGFFLPILWLFLLVVISIYYMRSAGITIFSFGENMTPRSQLTENVSQFWVILSFTIIAAANFLIYNFFRMDYKYRILLIIILLLYFIFQSSLGNRREIAGIIFFSISFFLSFYKKKINITIITILLIIFVGSFAITLERNESTRSLDKLDKIQLAIASNEFVYPIQTTYYILKDKWPYRYGSTYFLLPFQVLIPRIIYPGKPSTLGSEFILKTFGVKYQGFAYTPVSEAYLNFGFLGPFIIFFFVAMLFDFILKTNSYDLNYIYFLSYGLVFDFCRGDIASIFYAFVVMYFFGYRIISLLSKLKLKLSHLGAENESHS